MEEDKFLRDAAADLRYLLSRGYPKEASITLVGNRYNLPREGREILRRGVFSPRVASSRKNKLLFPWEVKGRRLAVDGYNVLITVESALKGKVVLLSDDGLMRDISGVSGAHRWGEETERAWEMIVEELKELGPQEVQFYFDSPISRSGLLAKKMEELLREKGVEGGAQAVRIPEREIIPFEGVVVSSDGAIVDQVKEVFDLAGHLIRERIKAPYIDLLSMA